MEPAAGGMRPGLAAALAVVGFGALAICGLGVLSLVSGSDVIAVRGLTPIPGAAAFAAAVIGLAATLAATLRRPHPSYAIAAVAAVVTLLAHLSTLGVAAVVVGVDPARALAAIGAFAVSWFAVVLGGSAAVAGWTAVALVRTRARPPHWGWEDDEDH
ncbi:hypothetical protein [Microbacterium radiodurans]|uniref:Uncharacterized protein n=1 Tax=Microbacterium radiodurans TaxID=661398 RepID=A0A5J5IW00_9MICO|nr:hypothetical protein [Microbacterium radiodurans]KAA9089002.1 hypothetical protein F6B42_00365 [Microbacterium radiodurans]